MQADSSRTAREPLRREKDNDETCDVTFFSPEMSFVVYRSPARGSVLAHAPHLCAAFLLFVEAQGSMLGPADASLSGRASASERTVVGRYVFFRFDLGYQGRLRRACEACPKPGRVRLHNELPAIGARIFDHAS